MAKNGAHVDIPRLQNPLRPRPTADRTVIVEEADKEGPFGAGGIGDPTILAMAPAIAKAIEDAVGVRITSLPITAEKVLQALREKGTTDEHR